MAAAANASEITEYGKRDRGSWSRLLERVVARGCLSGWDPRVFDYQRGNVRECGAVTAAQREALLALGALDRGDS